MLPYLQQKIFGELLNREYIDKECRSFQTMQRHGLHNLGHGQDRRAYHYDIVVGFEKCSDIPEKHFKHV